MRRLAAAVLLLVSLCAASFALADAPGTMSYQGVLTNDDGTLVADGNYDLTFRLYDVAFGGLALHTENFPAIEVERGGFSVLLGSTIVLPAIFDRQIYVGIQIGPDPELAPRVPLASSPYAMGLRFPIIQTQADVGSLLDLRNTLGLTATLHGTSRIGSENHSGQLDLVRIGSASAVSQWYTNGNGGNLDLFDELFNPMIRIQPDGNGSGGFMSLRRSTTSTGFIVDGNIGGTQDPALVLSGASRVVSMDMSQSGNGSVVLPTDAISAAETLDEAGVASINQSITTGMDGSTQNLLTRSITVPASGYCLVMASVEAQLFHNNGVATSATFGVSDVSASFPGTQDFLVQTPSAAATGTYIVPVSVHGLFSVNAGPNTFYLIGDESSGTVQWSDAQFSIVYFPTAYGTVTSSLTAGGDGGFVTAGAAPLTGLAEARDAEAFHRVRLEREMTEMQAQMAALQQKLERVESEQGSSALRKEK